jgi:perosamine synthetase
MISHNKPTIGRGEEIAVQRVLKSNWIVQGEEVEAFENEFCNFLGLPGKNAVAVSSGTAALYLALWVLNSKNKNVLFPAYTCSAVRNAVAFIQGKEKLFDIAEGTPNIDISSLKYNKGDILIAPHMFGIPTLLQNVDQEKCHIIEDCCQAVGAMADGNHVGLVGGLGIFSFYATKLLTTAGQGGMIFSRNSDYIKEIRDFREFDCRNDRKIRFNFQMTDIAAATGRVQLKKLSYFIKRREEIFDSYKNAGFNMLDMPCNTITPYEIKPVRYRALLKINNPKVLKLYLQKEKIKTIIPIEDWELLGDKNSFPQSYALTNSLLSLPCYPSLSKEELQFVINGIDTFLQKFEQNS